MARKSVDDIGNQLYRIGMQTNFEGTRYAKAMGAAQRYVQNIDKKVSYDNLIGINSDKANARKYARSTYMGMSNG